MQDHKFLVLWVDNHRRRRGQANPPPPWIPTSTSMACAPSERCCCERYRGGVPCAVRALCEKLAGLHHREFGKFRSLKGRH